jgi:hypothetical protein
MTILYSEHRRVLLIDENSRRLNLLATILRNHEVEVHPASRLNDAQSLWKNIPYDLVLLAAPENSEQAALASLRAGARRHFSRCRRSAVLAGGLHTTRLVRPGSRDPVCRRWSEDSS